MNDMEDLDYIKRRDELVRTMQKQTGPDNYNAK